MMDDQQMKQISAWLDKTMSAEETELFLQARINDPEFDEECKAMQEIVLALSEIDRDLQPSPQFHGNVMKRLEAECMTAIKDETQGRPTGEEIKTAQGPDYSRKPVPVKKDGAKNHADFIRMAAKTMDRPHGRAMLSCVRSLDRAAIVSLRHSLQVIRKHCRRRAVHDGARRVDGRGCYQKQTVCRRNRFNRNAGANR